MSQPVWKFLINLGDASPLDSGGLFVYLDETGVYPPEMERVEMVDEEAEEGSERYEVHRVILDRCTLVDGVLSDNEFHPDHAAWFARGLEGVASFVDSTVEQLREQFCHENPLERADAYRAIYDYHGWANGDDYPLTLTREEAEERYREEMK